MTCITPCKKSTSDAGYCRYCLQIRECKELREAICRGCLRESTCPGEFKHKRAAAGCCYGREMRI